MKKFTKAQSEPILTVEGKKWCQLCFICNKQINFLKASKESYVVVGQYVRHKRCRPEPIK